MIQNKHSNMLVKKEIGDQESCPPSTTGSSFQNILELPDDVLYLILRYCDVKSLGRLCQVCKLLNRLASSDHIWKSRFRNLTLLSSNSYNGRQKEYSVKEAMRFSKNRLQGHYFESVLLRFHKKQLPWMQFERDELWVSMEKRIRCFQEQKNSVMKEVHGRVLSGLTDDVTKFVVKGNRVVSGCRNGSVHVWDRKTCERLLKFDGVHKEDIHSVDYHDNTIVSGSRDATVKVISCDEDDPINSLKAVLFAGDRVWSVAICPNGSLCASGTAFCRGEAPVGVWDLNRASLVSYLGTDNKVGAGVLDMKFETPDLLLTGGYDTYVKLWDLRTNTCVCQWEEPFDSTVCCLQTDNDMTIFTGTARHGMVRLWDKRKTTPLQMYYCGNRSSPVYSLCFDAHRLYTALDQSVHVLDFSRY